MADLIIYSVMDIYLIGIATVLAFITAIRYFTLAKRKENPNEKSINKAYAWIFLIFTIQLILLNLSFFYLEGAFIGIIFRGNFDNPSQIYMWLYKGANISYYAAFIYIFIHMKRSVIKKYILLLW